MTAASTSPRLNTAAANALLLRVGKGDQAAFAQFYDQVSGLLYSMALRCLDTEHEAREALHEGMVHLWRKAPTFNCARASALSWSVMRFRSRLVDHANRSATGLRTLCPAL